MTAKPGWRTRQPGGAHGVHATTPADLSCFCTATLPSACSEQGSEVTLKCWSQVSTAAAKRQTHTLIPDLRRPHPEPPMTTQRSKSLLASRLMAVTTAPGPAGGHSPSCHHPRLGPRPGLGRVPDSRPHRGQTQSRGIDAPASSGVTK